MLPLFIPVEHGKVIINGQSYSIIKRCPNICAKKHFTEWVYFTYEGIDYIGQFGRYCDRWQVRGARPLKRRINIDSVTLLTIPRKDTFKHPKKMKHGHTSVERLSNKGDFASEDYNYDYVIKKINTLFSGKERTDRIEQFKKEYDKELDRRAFIERTRKGLDGIDTDKDIKELARLTDINRSFNLGGRRIESA